MKHHKIHWYLVAHRAGARLFEQTGVVPHLTIVHRFENPQGRLRESELVADRQGRGDQTGFPGHTALGSDYSMKEEVVKTFVHGIASFLEVKANQKAFDSLVLVAEPSLLGEIKGALGRATTVELGESIIKDLLHVSDHDMEGVLREHLCSHEEIRV